MSKIQGLTRHKAVEGQTLTLQMAAAYLGCEVMYPTTNPRIGHTIARLTGVSIAENHLETTYKRKKKGCSSDYLSFKPNGNHNCDALHTRLVLTPLSEISLEDALLVSEIMAKIYGEEMPDDFDPTSDEARKGVKRMGEELQKRLHEPGFDIIPQIIDLLRSKGYDCGYGGIPSLIEAGIAVIVHRA